MEYTTDADGVITPFFRTPYNYDRDAVSLATGVLNTEPSMTQQQFAEDADINTIVRRFGLTGELPKDVRVPTYGDFTEITDFRGALQAIESARDSFMAMPARVRAEFENDPAQFVDFCSDPDNLPRMRELGLAVPAPSSATTGSPTATPSPPPEPASDTSTP